MNDEYEKTCARMRADYLRAKRAFKMRPAELEQAHLDRIKRVGVTVGAAMMSLGFIIGYTVAYIVWRYI